MRLFPFSLFRPLLLVFAALLLATPTMAQELPASGEDLVKRLQEALAVRDRVIRNLIRRIEVLEKEVGALKGAPPAAEPAEPTALIQPAPEAPTEEYGREDELAQAALERTLIQRGGLLLGPGTVEFEISMRYFNASSDRISIDGFTILPVLVVGDIVSERIRRDILLPSFSVRIGLPKSFQFDVRMPFGYEAERIVTGDNMEKSRSSSGIGDLDLGISKQIARERGVLPDLLAGFRWKSTSGGDPFSPETTTSALGTGFGFHSFTGSLTGVKVRDPVVYFGGFSYTTNLADTKQVGRINPGDPVGVQFGLAMALNLESSISFSWEQRFTGHTKLEGIKIPGSFLTEGTFRVGTSYVLGPGKALDLGVGIGLTQDAPDVQFNIAIPFRFSF